MANAFTVIIDDQDPGFEYKCPVHCQKDLVGGGYWGSTWTTITDESCRSGVFNYVFQGTGIRLQIPTSSNAPTAAVLLDNQLHKLPESGLFEAYNLKDAPHNLTYAVGEVTAGPIIDYLTITAGKSTALQGRTLVADNTDPGVVYKGGWTLTPPEILKFDYSTHLYLNSAQWTSTQGDTAEFSFIGSSVSVYGLAHNITDAGNITAAYTIDGVATSLGLPGGILESVPMTELFHADLEPGSHTLLINITQISPNQAFGLDFFAFNSSVNNVVELPGYEATANAATNASGASGSKGTPSATKAVLGGVFGAIGFFLLLALVFFVWKKRQPKTGPSLQLQSGNSSETHIGEPPMTEKPAQQ